MWEIVIPLCFLVATPALSDHPISSRDSLICERVFAKARSERIDERALGEVVVWAGKQFLGSPYASQTLEHPGEERLVLNLREFDCVTFVENVLALSQCIKEQTWGFDDFKQQLRSIRYRGGTLEGYASRLHYFSEWISDNHTKGIVSHLTLTLGGELRSKPLDWMTKHRPAYRPLSDAKVFQTLGEIERSLSQIPIPQIPRIAIQKISSEIMPGDVIAFASNRPGLDVEHVGIAVPSPNGVIHLLHASDRGMGVVLTQETLDQYLEHLPRSSGIMVARPRR